VRVPTFRTPRVGPLDLTISSGSMPCDWFDNREVPELGERERVGGTTRLRESEHTLHDCGLQYILKLDTWRWSWCRAWVRLEKSDQNKALGPLVG
jgi:hypothetical protein